MSDDLYYIIDHKNIFNQITREHSCNIQLKMFYMKTLLQSNPIGSNINKYFSAITNNQTEILAIMKDMCKSLFKEKQLSKEHHNSLMESYLSDEFAQESIIELNTSMIDKISDIIIYVFYKDMPNFKRIKSHQSLSETIAAYNNSNRDIRRDYKIFSEVQSTLISIGKKKGKVTPFELYQQELYNKKVIDFPLEFAILRENMSNVRTVLFKMEQMPPVTYKSVLVILFNYTMLFDNVEGVQLDFTNRVLSKEMFKKYHHDLMNKSSITINKHNSYDNDDNTNEYYKRQWSLTVNHLEGAEDTTLSSLKEIQEQFINHRQDFSDNQSICINSSNTPPESLKAMMPTYATTSDLTDEDNNKPSSPRKTLLKSSMTQSSVMTFNTFNRNTNCFNTPITIPSKDYEKIFELCIIYPYFISQWKTITSIEIISPTSFSKEVIEYLQFNYSVMLMNYSFFDYFTSINYLNAFTMEFNSLDRDIFEKVMSVIDNNNSLKTLTLSLFTSDLYYQPAALYRMMGHLKINIEEIINSKNIIRTTNELENDKVEELFIKTLLPPFYENIEKLFWLIKDNNILREVNLFLASPSLISNNESYAIVLTKTVFNFFLMLNNAKSCLTSFKLIAPYLILDNRKCGDLHDLFDYLDYEENNKHLTALTIQIQFHSLKNIGAILSSNLIEINLGDLDAESFIAFVKELSKEDFIIKSRLRNMSVALLGRVKSIKEIKESLIKYLTVHIKTMEVVQLNSVIHLEKKEMNLIYKTIDYSTIRSHEIILDKSCEHLHMKPMSNLWYYDINHDHKGYSMLKAFTILINKRRMIQRVTKPINSILYGRLMGYLMQAKHKHICISYK